MLRFQALLSMINVALYQFGGGNCYTLPLFLLMLAHCTPTREIFLIFLQLPKDCTEKRFEMQFEQTENSIRCSINPCDICYSKPKKLLGFQIKYIGRPHNSGDFLSHPHLSSFGCFLVFSTNA